MRCSSAKGRSCVSGRKPASRRRGLTLLEVMVALAIASAGFGAVATGLIQSQRARVRATEAEAELALARALVEEVYLGLMPEQEADRSEQGVRRWKGERSGRAWEVAMSLQAVKGLQAARVGVAAGVEAGALSTPMLAMDVVRVKVGKVELTTVRW